MDKWTALSFLCTCSLELYSLVYDLHERFEVPETADLYNLPLRIEQAKGVLAASFEPEQLTLWEDSEHE